MEFNFLRSDLCVNYTTGLLYQSCMLTLSSILNWAVFPFLLFLNLPFLFTLSVTKSHLLQLSTFQKIKLIKTICSCSFCLTVLYLVYEALPPSQVQWSVYVAVPLLEVRRSVLSPLLWEARGIARPPVAACSAGLYALLPQSDAALRVCWVTLATVAMATDRDSCGSATTLTSSLA